jgi:glycolate oxidase FAD binding subunit
VTRSTNPLPLAARETPADQRQLAEIVRGHFARGEVIYALGGETSLDFGLNATREGTGLSLANLSRVVDYPARDMTITVEAGITMTSLAEVLRREGQRLPIDVAQPDRATLGGVIATNFSGPRRFGAGTIRDYVIGISAVDGTGTEFKAGGRVVKNVAGYDLCKLLVGSLGTLAIVTQVTLKVRPIPAASAIVYQELESPLVAEQLLAALVTSQTAPVAIELLAGPAWHDDLALGAPTTRAIGRLVVGLEGTADEVAWMQQQLADEWAALGAEARQVDPGQVPDLWQRMADFPAQTGWLTIKASVVPEATLAFVSLLLEIDPACSIQAHAGSGIVVARFRDLAPVVAAKTIVNRLQPAARAAEGDCIVLAYPAGFDATRQVIWGGQADAYGMMRAVKEKLDPRGILNPGRFVY